MENVHTLDDLKQMQSLPLNIKIRMTENRIRDWINYHGTEGVYISFSGGKDSTVLLDIVRKNYKEVKAVFINTGLEYPKLREFVRSVENVEVIRPTMNFREVLINYGYPVISKEISEKAEEVRKGIEAGKTNTVRYRQFMGLERKENGEKSEFNCDHYKYLLTAPFKVSDKCCEKMKKEPAHKYGKEKEVTPIIAIMAAESRNRRTKWIKNGCNAWNLKNPESNPMSFWTENDVLEYIHKFNIQIAEPYGEVVIEKKTEYGCKYKTTGCSRTGCIFCLFGIRQDKERIARLQIKEPKLADYVLRGGEFGENGFWQPSNNGLGYWFIIEWLNIHNLGIVYYKDIDYSGIYGNERTRKILIAEKIKVVLKKTEVSDDSND